MSKDTIYRQDAINKIVETSDEIYKIKQKGATYPHDDFFQGMAYAENIVKQLPPAQPEQHWIPCSERLPERGIDVLVTRDYDGRADFNKSCRYVEVASRYGEDDDVVWNSYSDEYKMSPKNHKVIAWMPLPPLPQPYKGGETE